MRKRMKRRVWPKVNPIILAIEGARVISDVRLAMLAKLEGDAIAELTAGTDSAQAWRCIVDMSNIAQTMCGMGIGKDEVMPVAMALEHRLLQCEQRWRKSGIFAMDATDLLAVSELQEYHQLQRTSVDRSTYERAIAATHNRIRSANPSLKRAIA
jgi:hypothetical protein